jgi:hypothetical protein
MAERVARQPFLGVRLDSVADPPDVWVVVNCEFASETDPTLLRRGHPEGQDGAGGDYWWVECGACDTAWQVPHYPAESVG